LPKIVNFHIPADDVERASAFYKAVFGWEFAAHPQAPEFYFVHDGQGDDAAGIPAAITKRHNTVKAPVPTIEVEDIDVAMTDIALKGGRQARVDTIPGVGRFGYAMDSEENVIALLQRV
jgi:predicted enzyme related to lactoylglutathione lyase